MFFSEHGQSDWRAHHGTLHYVFEAALPFIQVSKWHSLKQGGNRAIMGGIILYIFPNY